MRKLHFVWAAILVAGVWLWNTPQPVLYAQPVPTGAQAVVLPPVTAQDHGSTLSVRVPFQLRDGEGQSINNAAISGLQLRLIDLPPGAINTFPVGEAQRIETPLFVSLVIDASGSMEPYIDAVRAAARTAVNSAPDNARFRIVSFRGRDGNNNPVIEVRQDFTTDRGRILNAIDSIVNPDGATCYYDSVYESLDRLDDLGNSAGPNARKAVVAFTDGEDIIAVNDTRPCSRRSIDEVIREARRSNIPVYTIGMYGNNPANIKGNDLRRLADETRGLAAIGGQNEIDDLFKQVFAGLVNQYVANFDVLAKTGRNEGFLEIRLSGVGETIKSPVFEFDSPKNYISPTPIPTRPPAPTPRPTTAPTTAPTATSLPATDVIFNGGAKLDPDRGVYVFSISIGNPRIIDRLVILVLDGNGVQTDQQTILLDGRASLDFDIALSRLKPDQEYVVRIQGIDKSGILVPKPQRESALRDEPQVILDETKFKHVVEQAAPLEVKIRSIRPDFEQGKLIIELDINQPNLVDDYQVLINNEAGLKIWDTGLQVYPPGAVEVPVSMPPSMQTPSNNPLPQELKLFLSLWTAQNERTDAEPFEFELTPPQLPGLFQQITAGLEQNPLLAIGLVVVISSVVLFILFGRRPKKQAFSLARPVEEYTIIAGAPPADGRKRGKLLVEVVETPSPGDRVKRTINDFPCVIGRSQECQIRLTGDSQLSRQHARLTVENSRIILADIGSNNGTFVDGERIAANTPTPLSDGQVFQLGRHTKIRVSLQY